MVDQFSPTPLYVQLADLIAKRIESGELQPLKPLPSELRLQQEYGVARGTVRAAIALLRERGMVMTMPSAAHTSPSGVGRRSPADSAGRRG
ncbi:GntR family transcriptional regulator [Micromonospora sp. WMMD714]|uniref:GntR family transcriptional regulator n=1 Tax=Micromonospora sp. WMMD714 TaxID=3016097 RepID=UPI00249ABD71|nr:GntR family transcriptional regulator [Micromonospora sp. WMMD714]WFE62896.1 GntR family transcriptional regulator [Micromonospora sp. WMMD714]